VSNYMYIILFHLPKNRRIQHPFVMPVIAADEDAALAKWEQQKTPNQEPIGIAGPVRAQESQSGRPALSHAFRPVRPAQPALVVRTDGYWSP
jgi:hypothetical protein